MKEIRIDDMNWELMPFGKELPHNPDIKVEKPYAFEEMKKMGPMKEILSMIPGVGKKLKDTDVDDKQVDYTMAIIRSMTMKERENPDIINPSRKRRIAAGCGLKVEDVNRLLNQYRQIQKVYKQLNGNGSKKMMKRMQKMGGMQGMGGFPNMPNFPM